MMKKKHVIAKLLVFAMLLSMLPLSAVAANTVGQTTANSAYVTISDVTIGTATLKYASESNGTYTFSADTNTKIPVGTTTVSFKVTGATGVTDIGVYKTGSDTTTKLTPNASTKLVTISDVAIASNTTQLQYTIKTNKGSTETLKLTFTTQAAVTVTLDKSTLELKVGESETLKATVKPTTETVTWNSSAPGVASVVNGKVTAVKEGEAMITAKAGGVESAPCKVTVTAKAAEEDPEEEPKEETVTVTPDITTTEGEDGKTVGTLEAADAGEVLAALENANQMVTAGTEETVVVKIDVKTADVVKLPGNVFKKANDYNTGKDTEIKVAVTLKGNKTITLHKAALAAMNVPEGVEVTMSLEETTEKDIPKDKKPDTTGSIKAAFEVNITLSEGKIDWGKGTANKITLTVPRPKDVPSTQAKLNKLAVYLDTAKARGAKVIKNGSYIDIAVPHLTIVSLVEEESSTGGGGGGSGKPSVKPGETQTPTTPSTTPSGVAGFSDVSTSSWYAEYVKYVVDKGLFGGVGNGRFAPNENMTRAMMWTVLARYMGVDTTGGANWYEAARAWAIAQGISDGTMADGNVTREQFVTMLWRLCGEPAVSNSASFTDSGSVSAYAKTAVDWAVAQGIVNGYNDGSFKPQGSATRAEVAKMLTVFCTNAENAPAETTPAEPTEDVG